MTTALTDDLDLHAVSPDLSVPPNAALAAHCDCVPDPGVNRRKRHRLSDILTIALCAILCGADDFVEIELFGRTKMGWFKERLDLPNGIPSHDTFTRVFAQLDPEAFRQGFLSWLEAVQVSLATTAEQQSVLPESVLPEQIAIDGKTLRHSFEAGNIYSALHMVSAWAHQSGLVLAQLKVDGKSNEITAVPELLKRLDIAGCIVSMDAMHCHALPKRDGSPDCGAGRRLCCRPQGQSGEPARSGQALLR